MNVTEATVNIIHKNKHLSAGTGFYISENGTILTCKHVLEYGGYPLCKNEVIRIWRGDTKEYDSGIVVALSQDIDLAIIQIKSNNTPYLTIASTNEKQFTTTYVGYPFEPTIMSEGFGNCPRYTNDTLSLDQANTASPGFSGGPLLLKDDTVIGIINQVSVHDENLRLSNYATAISSYTIVKEFRDHIGKNCDLAWFDTYQKQDSLVESNQKSSPTNTYIFVSEWVPYSIKDPYSLPIQTALDIMFLQFGGTFNEGDRWKDYIGREEEWKRPYLEAIRVDAIRRHIKISGSEHQEASNGAPKFNNGKTGLFSMRAWGDLMAAIWSEEENRDYSYLDFYLSVPEE